MAITAAAADGRVARALAPGLIAALSLAAWVALVLWSASPYARYLEHGGWIDPGLLPQWCSSVPGAERWATALLQATAWLLMIAAMMLPTVLPLLSTFRRVVAARADRGALLARVVGGYVVVWTGFGLVAHQADAALRSLAADQGWLARYGWLIGALVLAGAGAFQFSALKYRCLDRCRTPFGFVSQRWSGADPARDAWRIGLAHGIFCVGCCWALMLVMFAVGMGSFGWMLVLAALMAAEKNLPAGRRLAAPVGIVLIAAAAGLLLGAF